MFQLNKGGLGAPITPVPKFDATPFPELFTPIKSQYTPVDFTNAVQSVAPTDMNTIKGVSGKVYTSDKQLPLPPISSGSVSVAKPTLNTAVRAANLPSYVPSDTPKGLISRDDWNNFDDVNFYVGTDGKYYSTDPFFNRMIWRESKHDLNAKNGVFRGPTQIGKLAWTDAMPGISFDLRTDPEYAGKGAVNYAKWNIKQLKRAGIPVNTFTVYGAHNLGIGNLMAIYRDLDAPLTGKAKDAVLNNFNDSKEHAPELYKKYIRDPNSITGRDYMNLINAIFTNKE